MEERLQSTTQDTLTLSCFIVYVEKNLFPSEKGINLYVGWTEWYRLMLKNDIDTMNQ